MNRLLFIFFIFIPSVGLFGCESKSDPEKVLNVYNWANYIGKDTIQSFEKTFGVQVNYDNFSSNEELLAKLQAGAEGYDVIFPSDYMVQMMIAQGLLSELNQEQLPNLPNIDPQFLNLSFDPQNRHCIPYHWGTAGIAVNTKKISESVTSWDVLWDKRYANRISMLDDPRAGIIPALRKLNRPINTTDPQDIKEARDLLIAQKPLVKLYTSDTYPDLLRSEEIWLAQAYTGDVYQVIKDKPEVAFVIPKEGTEIAIDSMCIPKEAPHKDIAHTFINYILSAEVAASIANDIRYGSPNRAARELIDKDQLNDPGIYPPKEVMEKLVYQQNLGENTQLYDRAWSELKAK